ncbi:hypothetical protein [Rathayibacter sp. VKM Ac-2801]|uniref:hypothetical protein n=1 Tax=Rathayibacter sp. VKM Ac-2801 TaxID=2609255 RepID=UPI00132028FD|nr:hypothetical protein [Rathayibacter sp. VKM Ac-2801]QHC71787.1 hypothetical protein GSU45_16260 [Rathayibacter sp. VKM Ac-2801]
MTAEDVRDAELEKRLKEYVLGLEAFAEDRGVFRRDVRERTAIALMADVTVNALNSSADIVALVMAFRRYPEARLVWERYLVLHLYEGLRSFPKMMSQVSQEARRVRDSGSTVIDQDAIDDARKTFTAEMRPVLDDATLMADIKRIRNTAAAHHGADGLSEWALEAGARRAAKQPWDQSRLVDAAMLFIGAAVRAGSKIFNAFDLDGMPPMPTNEVEMSQYRDREAALDRKHPAPQQRKQRHRR